MLKLGKTTVTLLTDMAVNPSLVADFCDGVVLTHDPNVAIWDAPKDSGNHKNPELICFKNVPSYLSVDYPDKEEIRIHPIDTVVGYAIDLHKLSDVTQYIGQNFSKKARGNILRGLRRLEDSFNIRYERFFGAIDKHQCQHLMILLKEMIITRFEERNETSHTLRDWEAIWDTLHSLILNKKASLFVIYHRDKPISISVAYHFNTVFFYYITAFDITYSKFSMGNIMLYKQLEWSIANEYLFFEMGWGDLDYKRRWSNRIEPLVNYYIFPKRSVDTYLRFAFERYKSLLITFLISRKVNVRYRQIKNFVMGNKSNFVPVIYQLADADRVEEDELFSKVDTELPEFSHLKTILNDFIYTSQELYENSQVVTSGSAFYIKGKKSCKKIILQQF